MTTDAPDIFRLEGPGNQVGGSFGVPVPAVPVSCGVEINIIPDPGLNKTYFGVTKSVGLGTPGAEAHVEWGKTKTIFQNNISIQYIWCC